MCRRMFIWTLVSFVAIGFSSSTWASSPKSSAPSAQMVDMFQAMRAGQIEVKFIPKDAKQATVLIKNKTEKPLTIKLPEAFAAVPVLAQFDAGGLGASSTTTSSTTQALGGGWGTGMMGGLGGMGMGGGMWNVPPEKIAQLKVPVVCLEHGKPDPRPAVPYQIKPLEEFTTTAGVREVLQALANGLVSQRVAQIAAWHLQNGLSFQELASKQLRFANGTRCPYFSPAEIRAAIQLVAKAKEKALSHQPPSSPGEAVPQNKIN